MVIRESEHLPRRCTLDVPPAPTCAARRRGLVLPLVLIALAVAIILGMCFLTSAATATSLSAAADHRLRARMIAESGLAMTLAYVEAEPTWRTQRANNGEWVTKQPLNGGTFTVSGHDGDRIDATGAVAGGDSDLADDVNDPVLLTCVGEYGGARSVARAVRQAPKPSGISVNERIEVKRTAIVDSFDQNVGAYSPATATATATARSNGVLRQPYVRLHNRAQVNGDVYYGPDGILARAVSQDPSVILNGSVSALPAVVALSDIVAPDWAANGGPNRSYSSTIETLTSDTWYGRLRLSGSATVRVVGDVKMYVGGELSVTDDARIEIGNPMAYAAGVAGTIAVNSSVPVDSYDSSLGPYGGTNVSSKAVLATNSTQLAAVTVQSAINGDVYTGVGSVPATSIVVTSGSVSGTQAAMTTPMPLPQPIAMPNDFPPSIGPVNVGTGFYTLNQDVQVDSVEVSGSGTFRVRGHRRVRINGDFLFKGSAIIDIPDNGSLSIYVAGRIIVNGQSALANTGHAPNRLKFFGTTTGRSHLLAGKADLYAIIDTPGSAVTMEGNAHLYGALIAGSLSMTGNSGLHNDLNPAVVDANPRLPATYTPGSKLTLYTNEKVLLGGRARLNAIIQNPQDVAIYHLGPGPMEIRDNVIVYANATAPGTMLDITGDAQWTGRIEARDLRIGGTAVVTADASGGTARPALVVDETIEVKDDAIVNAAGGTALIASNGATDTTIAVRDTAAFKGDGYTTPGGNPNDEIRVAPSATFTGAKAALTVPVPIAALTAPPVTTPVSNCVFSGTTTTVISGETFCDDFEARDSARVEISGDTRLIVTGDFRFTQDAQLVLQPGARLTVYCAGNVHIADNAQINVDGNPVRFTLSCPTAPRIELNLTSRLGAVLLAPLAELKLNDSAEFYGAFTGRRLMVDWDAKFHSSKSLPGPITWIEQE